MAVVKFSKQNIEPNPLEVDYWVDIKSDPYGSVWKYHNGINWVALNLAGGSGGGGLSPFDYYTKTQINDLLADKADIDFVESKVDDAEFAKVIQNIEFRPIGDNSVELVMLKYDGVVVGITMPVASETSAGLLSGDDFKNFVKQAQLQKLYSEMYNIVSKIREEYQPRLKAGSNIYIDEKTNTISATGELAVNWEDIPNIPIHLVQSVSTEDTEIRTLIDVDTNEQFVPRTHVKAVVNDNGDPIDSILENFELGLEEQKNELNELAQDLQQNTEEAITVLTEIASNTTSIATEAIDKSEEAIETANLAKTAVATLEGLANADLSAITAAGVVTQVEQNKLDIESIRNSEELLSKDAYKELEKTGQVDPTKKYYIYDN